MNNQKFDSEELLHLAIHASLNGRIDDAIAKLKELLEVDPSNPNAHFLLAADYAEIKLFDKSVSHYREVLKLRPEMSVARIQFALLLTALDNLDEAAQVLEYFAGLEDESYERFVHDGLIALHQERMAEAKSALLRAIESNSDNAVLNSDLQKIVDAIVQHLGTRADQDAQVSSSSANGKSFLLSAYGERG
ncbi:tetratricopeptide repeat protein [Microbulbifer salipaludis]|uniref:Tetratricopeptide repeat protein n=1 Tax=Microbulbifer salipaludis TaxID=187980 RepID=A0ABS3EA11_9GAMM|nr:tetratricopeptide repeat protein [Microbulbifer salipaludis]MBN8432143.1 tetratricopeptide repeat protein [Microbulbifer salipaludis]